MIKVKTTDETAKIDNKFPMLMYSHIGNKIQIVLMTGINDGKKDHTRKDCLIGTNVNGIGWPVGYHSEDWASIDSWKPYLGEITLTNEKE
jgi:hypothetical protein